MVRASKKKDENGEVNPEAEERKRLKTLALSKNILSETPAKAYSPLTPSKIVIKHHGKDIIKKSQRKNRFLFSFSGLLAPIAGGKIGELKDLGTKNPILYLDFPQGQMKLFGTIVYPKNRYLTLQFSRGGKNVICEDYFDTVIVFSDVWWIGKKDENPEEDRLDFPKELNEGQPGEYDFSGGAGGGATAGAGVVSETMRGLNKSSMRYVEEESPKATPEDDISDAADDDDEKNLKDVMKVTPVRQSERTAGKRYKFAESSSLESDSDIAEGEEEKEDDDDEVFIVEEKKTTPRKPKKSPAPKVSGQKLNSKRKIDQADGPRKKGRVTSAKKKLYEEVEDDNEETSQGSDASDEEWAA